MLSLVGNSRGRKVIRWGYVTLAFLLTTLAAGGVAVGLYAALTRSWNPLVLLVGPVVGISATLLTLLVAWRTPLQRQQILR
jgi:hypothetical protein